MNQRKIGIVLSYVNIILHAVVGFLYVPILLHYIGKGEYGLYQLMGSLIAYFSIMDFGLTAAVIRFYTKYKALHDEEGMENILALSLRGYGIVTILVLGIGVFCYSFLDQAFAASMTVSELAEAKDIFLLLLLNIVITLSTMVFRAVINAYEKFLFLKGLETLQLISQPILVILVLQHYPSAFSVAAVQTGINIFLVLSRIFYSFHVLHVRIRFHEWDYALIHEFKRLALSVFVVSLIDQVFWKTNQILLGMFRGTSAVAVYSIASLIYMNYMALSTAISGVYLPHITEMVAKGEPIEKLSTLFIQIGRWQYYLLGLVASGFIIFGREFIAIWAGAGFEDAYVITLLIILPFTIDLIQNIGLAILQAMNRYELRARVYFFIGMLNLILAVPLGIKWGGIGCAVATGSAMLIGNGILMNWIYSTKIKLTIKKFWMNIGRITISVLCVLLMGLLLEHFVELPGKLGFIVKIVVYTFLYGGMIYKFAMNENERNGVKKIAGKMPK